MLAGAVQMQQNRQLGVAPGTGGPVRGPHDDVLANLEALCVQDALARPDGPAYLQVLRLYWNSCGELHCNAVRLHLLKTRGLVARVRTQGRAMVHDDNYVNTTLGCADERVNQRGHVQGERQHNDLLVGLCSASQIASHLVGLLRA
jgi:hypothetical protein